MWRIEKCFYSDKTSFGNSRRLFHLSTFSIIQWYNHPEAHFSGAAGSWLVNQLVKRSKEMSAVAFSYDPGK